MNGDPVLLYDGVCALCNGVVRFVIPRDKAARIRFAPLDGEFAQTVFARNQHLRGVDSVAFVEVRDGAERVHIRSDAIIALAPYLNGPWRAARVLRVIPRFLRDWAYDAVARVRYRAFGRYDACPLPPPADRARFIP